MAVNHNPRVLYALREAGYTVAVVEYWGAFDRKRHDLFGVIDVLAVGAGGTVAVQVTSRNNMASRVAKIRGCEAFPAMLAAGWSVQVWGYDKPDHRWRVKVADVTQSV